MKSIKDIISTPSNRENEKTLGLYDFTGKFSEYLSKE